jgi:chromosome segregation ATPase
MTTVINYITTGGLYVLFGIWSFYQVLEYKYYTRVEQYETIVENMKICKQKYIELLVKMTQLENRVDELEDILLEHNLDGAEEEDLEEDLDEELEEEKLSLDVEALKKAELEELHEVKELNEVKKELNEVKEVKEEKELNEEKEEKDEVKELNEVKEEKEEEKELNEVAESLEEEMVDISEETYPIKNQAQNKKGWLKTILFM